MTRSWIICVLFIPFIFPSQSQAAVKWYYNDSLPAATGGLTVLNLLEGDIVCARFFPDPGDYPLKILTLQILVKDGPGGDFIAKVFDGSAIHPEAGAEIFSRMFSVVPDVFFDLDVSDGGAYIYSGDFVAGYEIVSRDNGDPGTDNDGCSAGNNSIYFDLFSDFVEACPLFMSNDLVMRVEVETNVPTPTPSPSPTSTSTPTVTPTLSPTGISAFHTNREKIVSLLLLSTLLIISIKPVIFDR